MAKISAARIDLQNGRLDNAILKSYGETLVGGATGTNTGSAYTVDVSTGNVFFVILNSATVTFTFQNPSASGSLCYFTLILKQDGTGGRDIVWPSTVVWPGDMLPILPTAADQIAVLFFMTVNGGGTWVGSLAGNRYR